MRFLIDTKKKIIFGWSAKCGCSHIKRIFLFLNSNSIINNDIHEKVNKFIFNKLPNNIENYTTIIISRNPYKRIISGFLDKYKKNGSYRHLWTNDFLSFSQFLTKKDESSFNEKQLRAIICQPFKNSISKNRLFHFHLTSWPFAPSANRNSKSLFLASTFSKRTAFDVGK